MISGQGADCVPTYSSSSREGWQPGKFWRRAGVMGGYERPPSSRCAPRSPLAARRDFAVARTKPTVKATRSHLPCASVASVRLWPLLARSLRTTLR
jgi:hypothetical protein